MVLREVQTDATLRARAVAGSPMEAKSSLMLASRKLNFELDTMSFVWGVSVDEKGREKSMGKVHITGFSDDNVFLTLCGIDDVCGFWPFADESDFDSNDGCKNCKRILKILEKKEATE